jgi:hypothetical protein
MADRREANLTYGTRIKFSHCCKQIIKKDASAVVEFAERIGNEPYLQILKAAYKKGVY